MSYRHHCISTLRVCMSRPYDVLPSSLHQYIASVSAGRMVSTVIITLVHYECISAGRMMSYRLHCISTLRVCISRPYNILPSSLHHYIMSVYQQAVWCLAVIITSLHYECISAGRMMSYRHHCISTLRVCMSRPYDVLPSSLHQYIASVNEQAVWCLTVIITSVHCECVSAGRMMSYRHHYIITLWVYISSPYDVLPSSLHQYIVSVYQQAVWCFTVIIISLQCPLRMTYASTRHNTA